MRLNCNEKVTCGFPPSVFIRPNAGNAASVRFEDDGTVQKDADIYNISTLHSGTESKAKPTKNRKYITFSPTITRAGVEYEINNGKSGIYSKILHRIIDELDKCIVLWSRVLAIRFDLHHKGVHRKDNKWLSRLFQNLKRRIERAYGFYSIGYVWVREQEMVKSNHYHAAIFLDGDVVRHPAKLRELIVAAWSAINPVNTVYFPRNQYYFVDCEAVKRDVIYRVSYLAKVRGKGYRANQVKDFFCSNITLRKGEA